MEGGFSMSIKKRMAYSQTNFFAKLADDDAVAAEVIALRKQLVEAKAPKAKQRVAKVLAMYQAEASRRGIRHDQLSFVVMTDEKTGIKYRIPVR